MVANADPISTVDFMYTNAGPEDAVGLFLNFTDLPTYIRSVAIRREVSEGGREGGIIIILFAYVSTIILQGAMPAETPCTAVTSGSASCVLRTRFAMNSPPVSTTFMCTCVLKFSLEKNFAKLCYLCIMKMI